MGKKWIRISFSNMKIDLFERSEPNLINPISNKTKFSIGEKNKYSPNYSVNFIIRNTFEYENGVSFLSDRHKKYEIWDVKCNLNLSYYEERNMRRKANYNMVFTISKLSLLSDKSKMGRTITNIGRTMSDVRACFLKILRY